MASTDTVKESDRVRLKPGTLVSNPGQTVKKSSVVGEGEAKGVGSRVWQRVPARAPACTSGHGAGTPGAQQTAAQRAAQLAHGVGALPVPTGARAAARIVPRPSAGPLCTFAGTHAHEALRAAGERVVRLVPIRPV